MTKRAKSSKVGSETVPAEMNATERHAASKAALKDSHNKAKQQLKQQFARELAEEQAEERRQDDRRNYLLGQALRRDQSEDAVALASTYAERFTHPSDRKLFGLSPLPDGEKGAGSPMQEFHGRDQRLDDTPSMAAIDGTLTSSDEGDKRVGSEEINPTGTITIASESHPVSHEGSVENTISEMPDDMMEGVQNYHSDAIMPGSDESDGVAGAGPDMKDGGVDSNQNGGEIPAASSTATAENIGHQDGGTWVRTADLTALDRAPLPETATQSSFTPQLFLSQPELKGEIDKTGAKRSKTGGGRWIATASTPEQADRLVALKLQHYEPK